MKKVNNKKPLLFGGALCIFFAAIAITTAYNRDQSILANNFEPGIYKTITTEEFVSPDNWQPCDETPKTVIVTNDGDVDVKVRISYEDYWKSSNGRTLNPIKDGVQLANIVLQNENDWEYSNGYYYYKYTLAPGESSNSLFQKVVFNCDANMGGDNYCHQSANNEVVCEKPLRRVCEGSVCFDPDDYQKYHIKIMVETIQADAADTWQQLNYAIASKFESPNQTEKGKGVYAFGRNDDNNYIIWSDMCWLAIRTTYTGGVKMAYYGVASTSNGSQVCRSRNGITYDGSNNLAYNSPKNVGYMYGASTATQSIALEDNDTTTSFIFSNSVSRSGNTYTLDTSVGQFIEGTEVDRRPEARTRYHYFCTDGSAVCDNTKIGYLTEIRDAGEEVSEGLTTAVYEKRYLYYLPLDGYDDIDDLREALFANTNDSSVKTAIESWFEDNNLDDDDLEDAVYCNDRTIVSGPLASEEDNLNGNTFAAYKRLVSDSTKTPTLDCSNKNDAFTKDDTINGNGMLSHKVGLLTADEYFIAGQTYNVEGVGHVYPSPSTYLMSLSTWSMTPASEKDIFVTDYINYIKKDSSFHYTIRPAVSLKAQTRYTGGDGTYSNPYIVE